MICGLVTSNRTLVNKLIEEINWIEWEWNEIDWFIQREPAWRAAGWLLKERNEKTLSFWMKRMKQRQRWRCCWPQFHSPLSSPIQLNLFFPERKELIEFGCGSFHTCSAKKRRAHHFSFISSKKKWIGEMKNKIKLSINEANEIKEFSFIEWGEINWYYNSMLKSSK